MSGVASAASAATGPRALIADDEPLLRERLAAHLARLWPELRVVAEARNGREAVDAFDEFEPDLVFLDIHMPGLNGIEAARSIGRRAAIVFITAYDLYAVQAFEQGAIDYLLKPFDDERLATTVERLKQRLSERAAARTSAPPLQSGDGLAPVLERLARSLSARQARPAHLQWIKASMGQAVRLIATDEVAYLRSDEKYTLVVWPGGEAVIRKTIRELADELDPERFVQVHRSVIVNLGQVVQVIRHPNETAEIHLRGRSERLPVSRSFLHFFKQM